MHLLCGDVPKGRDDPRMRAVKKSYGSIERFVLKEGAARKQLQVVQLAAICLEHSRLCLDVQPRYDVCSVLDDVL
jgi:hypothetical protein